MRHMELRSRIGCMACGHEAEVTHEHPASTEEILATNIFRCDECGARMAFGHLMPRVVVEPFRDDNGVGWVRFRFQDPVTKADQHVVDLDPQFAAMIAKGALSIVIP